MRQKNTSKKPQCFWNASCGLFLGYAAQLVNWDWGECLEGAESPVKDQNHGNIW